MRMRPLFLALLLALPAAPVPAAVPDEVFDDYQGIYRDLSVRHAGAVVTVKFVMSVTNAGNEQRVEDRTQAVIVSPDGLLLLPARAVSVDFSAFGLVPAGQTAPVANSSEFRVRLADSEDWLPADLVTRDAELGLAWLRLREPPRGLPHVDLGQGAPVAPGSVFFTLMRASDEWGGGIMIQPGLVRGETRTPTRRLMVDAMPGLGFAHDGRPVGYADIDFAALMRTGAGTGMGLDLAEQGLRMIPIDKVAAATAQAAKLPVAGGTVLPVPVPVPPAGEGSDGPEGAASAD
ncbi:serine protease [Arenimonas composti]|uniref:Uncharacterized protein n=1 Tax=Arenimonas composti TR7-09 = DSM 18010 TaxID=1121013 RepID=A0A091BGI2_9GAMM|nr:serine protease [Arenimonas composti]KFN50861.1 hypothetical protein P873_00505 [Arenimonas composti TR7-09 = DSM 18010]